jgi:ketose-bisphosphate aldolase
MPLVPLHPLLAAAQRDSYAVCYCESWNLESLQAVIKAAEEMRSPAIAGFNGGFLSHRARSEPEEISFYAGFRIALERARIPVAFLLNEFTEMAQMREAIALGFNSVMPDNEGLDDEAYCRLVREVVALARPAGVFVEAQLGHLATGHGNGQALRTEPGRAAEFVNATGIDALAVSVGNVHILTEGKCGLDVDAIGEIRSRVTVPLVLHGGTGVDAGDLRRAIHAGVSKVNFGTVLKQAYLEAVRTALGRYGYPMSPHEFLGIGGVDDIMMAGRTAVKQKACELIERCGSAGRAA